MKILYNTKQNINYVSQKKKQTKNKTKREKKRREKKKIVQLEGYGAYPETHWFLLF